MLAKLLLAFTIIPIIELSILIPLGGKIGFWPTVAIVVSTALTGAILGKAQGLAAWGRIKGELEQGSIPGDSLLDGLAVLLACAFLVTPGILTDITGFTLLLPFTRRPVKAFIRKKLDAWLAKEQVGFFGSSLSGFSSADVGGRDYSAHAQESDARVIIEDVQDDTRVEFASAPSSDHAEVIDVTPRASKKAF